ncbi:MAG: lamin tail domain-containing protein [Clostridia bacterium]|nr:lamin tail domain-containing protein [Clostridia bacterium]
MKGRKLIIGILCLLLFAGMCIIVVSMSGGQAASNGASVRVNELMLSNKGSVADADGEFYDYVEFYNPSDADADITGFGLTDDIAGTAKFVFPADSVVPANGYLIVYCCGESRDGLYAPFKLSSSDVLIFMDVTGRVVDSLDPVSVASGMTLSLNDSGEWVEMSPSPGYPNTAEGIAAFQEQRLSADEVEGLYINEFMASNASTVADDYGEYSDWIELYNDTDEPMDLSGFYVSDDLNDPLKYELPQGTTIDAKGYLLIFCSGRGEVSASGEIHATFSLKKYKEDVVLCTPRGAIVDAYSYTLQEADVSMARATDGVGEFEACITPTPGFPNTTTGAQLAMNAYQQPSGELYISEVMGLNDTYLVYNSVYYDWIELHNNGAQAINLSGYGLSTRVNNPGMWTFPDVSIEAGQYLTIVCVGEDYNPDSSILQTPFNISAGGESVFLFDSNGALVDKLVCPKFYRDHSVGRDLDGTFRIFSEPTPKEANRGAIAGITEAPVFSVAAGAYDEAQSITITAPADADVYYTLDGSAPTRDSARYTGAAIVVDSTAVLRAFAATSGMYDSDIMSATYIIDDPHDLPIVSIAVDPAEYAVMYENYYEEIEIQMHFDYFENNAAVFSDDGIIRIFGALSRTKEQKGYALIARSDSGKQAFEYPFFDSRPFTEYGALVLRASGQESTMSRIRDIVVTSLVDDHTDLVVQAYQQCVLYINGEYTGVYNLREKINKAFLMQHYPEADAKTMDLLVGNGNRSYYILQGSNREYLALVEFAKENDLSVQSNYDYVAELVDVDNFAEYTAMQLYVGNTDSGNIKFWRTAGRKWQWITYDFCWALNTWANGGNGYEEGYKLDAVYRYLGRSGHGANAGFSNALINALLENDSFRSLFLEKCAKMANVVFEEQTLIARIEECAANIRPEMPRDTELWADITYESWEREIETLKVFASERKAYFAHHIRSYFNLSAAECVELFGVDGSDPEA